MKNREFDKLWWLPVIDAGVSLPALIATSNASETTAGSTLLTLFVVLSVLPFLFGLLVLVTLRRRHRWSWWAATIRCWAQWPILILVGLGNFAGMLIEIIYYGSIKVSLAALTVLAIQSLIVRSLYRILQKYRFLILTPGEPPPLPKPQLHQQ